MKTSYKYISELCTDEYFVQWILNPTAESTHYWSRKISDNPEMKKDVEMARQIILSVEYKKNSEMSDEDYNEVLNNIVGYGNVEKNKKVTTKRFFSVAAAVVLFISVSFVLLMYNTPTEVEKTVSMSEKILKKTSNGEKLQVRLPDGSLVVLNAGSELQYFTDFNLQRKTFLKGEAFFDVVENESRPFTVQTENVLTTVLGTSFNIRSYTEENKSAISVVSGKVKVSDNQGRKALLQANRQGVFDKTKDEVYIKDFKVEKILGWKDGLVTFDNDSFDKIFQNLERVYGVHFIIKGALPQGRYTGSYRKASLETILQGISLTSDFRFEIEGKEVLIEATKK